MPFHFSLLWISSYRYYIPGHFSYSVGVEEVRWFALLSAGRWYVLSYRRNEASALLNIPAGYRKTPPYGKSRLVRTYLRTHFVQFALLSLVADELRRSTRLESILVCHRMASNGAPID